MSDQSTNTDKARHFKIVFSCLLRLAAIVLVIEGAIMIAFHYMPIKLEPWAEIVADIVLLAGLSAPFVYWLGIRPYITRTEKALELGEAYQRQLEELNLNLAYQKYALDEHAIVSIADVKGNITYVNDKFCEISGYTREEIIGNNHRMVKSGHHPPEFYKDLWGTISQGSTWKGDILNLRKDGTPYWVSATIVPFLNEKRKPYQYVAIRADITARKEAEKQLVRTSKLASMGEMSTGIAHELNQPLNIIRMSTDMLEEMLEEGDVPKDVLAQKLARISEQVSRAAEITNYMRSFGKDDAKENAHFLIIDAIHDATGIIREQYRSHNIELEFDLPKSCRPVIGSKGKFEQMILNLLSNARHAIEENSHKGHAGGFISITLIDDEHTDELRLSVRDSGGGIAEDIMDKIFDPFFTTQNVSQGAGMGLSLSHSIISDMGGTISVENVGYGADFTISLPVALPNDSVYDAAE